MRFCLFILLVMLVVIVCSSNGLANGVNSEDTNPLFDSNRRLAKTTCNQYGIQIEYTFIVFQDKVSVNKFNECLDYLTDVSKRLGYNVAKQLFKHFKDYFEGHENRDKWFSWLKRITIALEKSGWDNYMKTVFIANLWFIRNDKEKTQRLQTAEDALTYSTVEWWRKTLDYNFIQAHSVLLIIDQIMSKPYLRTFFDLYLEWWEEWQKEWWVEHSYKIGMVRHGWYVDIHITKILSEFCSKRKDCYNVKSKAFLLFDVLHRERNLNIPDMWTLTSLEACLLKSSLANEAAFQTVLIVMGDAFGSHAFLNIHHSNPDWQLKPDDVWKLVLECGEEGDLKLCVSSCLRAIASTKAIKIRKLTFHYFMEKDVLENGFDSNVGYTFLTLLYAYGFNHTNEMRIYPQSEAQQNTAGNFITSIFKLQMTSQSSLGRETLQQALKGKAPRVEPMACLIEMVKSVWTVENIIIFINTAKECGLPSRDFAPFLYLIRKEFYQDENNKDEKYLYNISSSLIQNKVDKMVKIKEIMSLFNYLNLQFSRKSLWWRLMERDKGLVLYEFVEVQNYISNNGGGNNNQLLYYFFRNRKMIKCGRDTIISVWEYIKKANIEFKESDYNDLFEKSCEEERRREEEKRRLAEIEKKKEAERKRSENAFHRRQKQAATAAIF